MKTNLFTMSLVSVVLFACGGSVDSDQQGEIIGVSGVAGSANSIAGASSAEPDTFTTGGAFEISAGGTTSVGGSISETATGGATEPPCEPTVQVRFLSHSIANVEPGAQNVATLKFQLTATCIDQEVETLKAHIGAQGYDVSSIIPFRSANGENFQNSKIVDLANDAVVSGPILPKDKIEKAYLEFNDHFTLTKDVSRILEIRVDISSMFLTDSMSNRYTIYFNDVGIKNGGDVPIVTSYADGFDGANWPSFTVTSGSCRLKKTVPLSVYTTYNDLVGTSDGVIVHGYSKSSDGSSATSSEIQFWDPRTQTTDGRMIVGIESKILLESGSDQGFMAMINSPQGTERFPGDFAPLSLSFFNTKGVFQKNASIWSTAPRNDQIAAVTGSKEHRIIWIDDKTDFANPTIQSWTPFINSNQNGNSINVYTWPKDDTRPSGFSTNAVTNGQKTAVGISYACAVITPGFDCYIHDSILVWDDAQASLAHTTRLFITGNLIGLYASTDGFDAIIGEQGNMYVSKYDLNGQSLRRVNLPPNSRRVTAFRGGYAVVTTSPNNLKNFEFILVNADGTIKQTIPFQSDFDRYELAIGNLVVSGTGTLAFSWSGLGQTTSSSLAFFSCQ